jgi:hypothetical protein
LLFDLLMVQNQSPITFLTLFLSQSDNPLQYAWYAHGRPDWMKVTWLQCYHTIFIFEEHSIDTDTHTCMSTHPYKHTQKHPTSMSNFKRLGPLHHEIREVSHKKCLTVDGMPPTTERIISHKHNTHVKSEN